MTDSQTPEGYVEITVPIPDDEWLPVVTFAEREGVVVDEVVCRAVVADLAADGGATAVPAGHQCSRCGAPVAQTMLDQADDQGQALVVEETPLFCSACNRDGFAGRRIRATGRADL